MGKFKNTVIKFKEKTDPVKIFYDVAENENISIELLEFMMKRYIRAIAEVMNIKVKEEIEEALGINEKTKNPQEEGYHGA